MTKYLLMYQQRSGSGAKYQGRNEMFCEHQGEAMITWGYGAQEMRCRNKELSPAMPELSDGMRDFRTMDNAFRTLEDIDAVSASASHDSTRWHHKEVAPQRSSTTNNGS